MASLETFFAYRVERTISRLDFTIWKKWIFLIFSAGDIVFSNFQFYLFCETSRVWREMPIVKRNGNLKKCQVCSRSTRNGKTLGPFLETKTIAAHYKCVIFSPVMPDKIDLAPNGIGGVSSRFIRNEGKRAKPLVFFSLSFFRISVTSIAIIFSRSVHIASRAGPMQVVAATLEPTRFWDFATAGIMSIADTKKKHPSPYLQIAAQFPCVLNIEIQSKSEYFSHFRYTYHTFHLHETKIRHFQNWRSANYQQSSGRRIRA